MKRFIKSLGLIFCLLMALVFLCYTPIYFSNQQFQDGAASIFCAIVFLIPIIIWQVRKRKRKPETTGNLPNDWNQYNPNSNEVLYESYISTRTNIHRLPPRKNEPPVIGILIDSLKIVVSTDKPDTYLSRFDLIKTQLSRIPKGWLPAYEKKIVSLAKELIKAEKFCDADFVKRYYIHLEKEIGDLKTAKAKHKRIELFQSLLNEYPRFQTDEANSLLMELKKMVPDTVLPTTNTSPLSTTIEEISESCPFTFFSIPESLIQLLWFENGPNQNISTRENEPSAIDLTLPICKPTVTVNAPGYYPSYRELTPEQRWIYLNWLCDITKPVDIGFVFILYYGLERHLFSALWKEASLMIQQLRKLYTNQSFLRYSADALILAATVGQHPEIIEESNLIVEYPSLFIRRYGYLTIDMILSNVRSWGFTNTRYLTGKYAHPQLFRQTLGAILQNKYKEMHLPIAKEDLDTCQKPATLALANYSLKYRTATIEDLSYCPGISHKVAQVLEETHQQVKEQLAKQRTKQK